MNIVDGLSLKPGEIRFKKYIPTVGDSYMEGVVEVEAYVPVILRYKKAKNKDGGHFFVPPSVAIDDGTGTKKYLGGHDIDSRSVNEAVIEIIKANILKKDTYASQHVQMSFGESAPSVFNDNAPF